MPMTSRISVSARALQTGSSDLASRSAQPTLERVIEFADGAGAGAANLAFSDTRTIAAGANDDIDLVGGLIDAFGAAISPARIKAIMVTADAANVDLIRLGGASAAQFVGPMGAATHTIAIAPGGVLLIANPTAIGWATAQASTDTLRIANAAAAAPATYSIVILAAAT